ncbi:hypothetical protein [Prescottella equi]
MAVTWQNLGPVGGRRVGFIAADLTRPTVSVEAPVALVDAAGQPLTLNVTAASKIILTWGCDNLLQTFTWRLAAGAGSVTVPTNTTFYPIEVARTASPGTGPLTVYLKRNPSGSATDKVVADQFCIVVA